MERIFIQAAPAGSRNCGSCTACCKTHEIESPEFSKPPGKWCVHCDIGRGCRIYGQRPDDCKQFVCEWLKGAGGDELRPDRAKLVLDFVKLTNGLPGGCLQIWEVSEGALTHSQVERATHEALGGGVWVLHISLGCRSKKLFVPPQRELTDDIRASAESNNMRIFKANSP